MCVCVCVYTLFNIQYIYIYIYIYIYYHRQIDHFVESQFFSVTRHLRLFNLGSKPGRLYVIQISYPKAIIILSVSKGSFYVCT